MRKIFYFLLIKPFRPSNLNSLYYYSWCVLLNKNLIIGVLKYIGYSQSRSYTRLQQQHKARVFQFSKASWVLGPAFIWQIAYLPRHNATYVLCHLRDERQCAYFMYFLLSSSVLVFIFISVETATMKIGHV